ncbi:MAG: DUF3079 domain-containing protein [Acidobacteriia bacterium]|nr:DUF3079 domain-containing protein [Terriglobia bacterium]
MAKPRIALNPKHPERLCWGCEKLCDKANQPDIVDFAALH